MRLSPPTSRPSSPPNHHHNNYHNNNCNIINTRAENHINNAHSPPRTRSPTPRVLPRCPSTSPTFSCTATSSITIPLKNNTALIRSANAATPTIRIPHSTCHPSPPSYPPKHNLSQAPLSTTILNPYRLSPHTTQTHTHTTQAPALTPQAHPPPPAACLAVPAASKMSPLPRPSSAPPPHIANPHPPASISAPSSPWRASSASCKPTRKSAR